MCVSLCICVCFCVHVCACGCEPVSMCFGRGLCACRMVIREEWEAGKHREDGASVVRVQVKREKDVL